MSLFNSKSAKHERRASAERLYEHHEDYLEREQPPLALSLDPVISNPFRANVEMCAYCFDAVLNKLNGQGIPSPLFDDDVSCPFFVTWEKYVGGSGRKIRSGTKNELSLRGCIGTLSPQPLSRLADYAKTSAFNDSRFSPIAEYELSSLKCSVSLLVEYEDAEDVEDWEVGKHGILISFTGKNGIAYSATYLPEVAQEHGWTKEEAIESLVRKSGYNGPITAKFLTRVELTRYQSSKCGLHHAAYIAMRDSNDR